MKITNPLDKILDNEAKVKILRFLFKTNAEWNGRQIAREVGITPATAHKALQSLNRAGVLFLRNMGNTHIYTLNQNNFTASSLLKPLFAKEEEVLNHILKLIKRKVSSSSIKKEIVSVALFGSVSARGDHAASDIDLAVIVRGQKTKPKAELLFEEMDKTITNEFGNALSPYVNTTVEFKAKYKKGLKVIKNILKSHKLIYGKQLERIL